MIKYAKIYSINKIIIKNSLPLNYKIYYKFELFSIIILSWRKNFSRLHIYIIPSKLIDRYRWISKARILLLSFKPMKNSFAFFNDLHNKKKKQVYNKFNPDYLAFQISKRV